MCDLFEEIKAEGRAEGKAEGRAGGIIVMGRSFGLSDDEIIDKLQEILGITSGKAEEYMELYGEG